MSTRYGARLPRVCVLRFRRRPLRITYATAQTSQTCSIRDSYEVATDRNRSRRGDGRLHDIRLTGPADGFDGELAFALDPVEHVDTLIGTGKGGETVGEIDNFPWATVPFGMVQYSPDTVGNYAGYNFNDPRSTGFSMTNASVGCAAFGDVLILPTTSARGRKHVATGWTAHQRNSTRARTSRTSGQAMSPASGCRGCTTTSANHGRPS